ncbi:hypothetical protein JIQ42_02092 [Leishmania sp. Namibia]|uniref:hypothetical protein n=1 Tax=Leishmania sp. Namibia TaxID=2802991 RepID=UPI001B71BF2A|nr:hypothetical protein JIQ42_02092 [Leishmania sp. Namibia]
MLNGRTGSGEFLPMEPIPGVNAMTTAPLPRETAPKPSLGSPSLQSREKIQASDVESASRLPSASLADIADVPHGDVIVCPTASCGDIVTPYIDYEATNCEEIRFNASEDKSADSTVGCIGMMRRFLLDNDPLLYNIIKWHVAALLLLFLTFIVFGVFYSGIHYNGNCTDHGNTPLAPCATPFGSILGAYNGVFAYSNCNDSYVSAQMAHINLTVLDRDRETGKLTRVTKQFQSGMEWQCVEYARRYWMQRGLSQPAYFDSVVAAADIWNLTFVRLVSNASMTLPLHRFRNGDRLANGINVPEVGDIIIYPIQPGGFPYGHVAVIAKVELATRGAIYVAEQNWDNKVWAAPDHSLARKIPLRYDMLTTTLTIDDPEGRIIGWMRYG